MNPPHKIRWMPLLVGCAVIGAAQLGIILIPALADSPYRAPLLVLGLLLMLLWLPLWILLLSRLRWKTRVILLAAFTACGIFLGLSLRIDGYHGDILPILGWVWEPAPGEVYDSVEGNVATWNEELPGSLDFPMFLGAGGFNHVSGELLPRRWFELEPEELWRRKVGLGWSSFAVARGLAITQEQRGDEEFVVAYALEDGQPIWTHRHPARFEEEMGGDGPRATPTIAGEKVLTMGATGILDCLELRTGKLLWTRSVLQENGHRNLTWAKSGSPLVVEDRIVVTLGMGEGGSTAAYALEDGAPVWRTGDFEASYATPVLRVLDGVPQLVVVYATHLAGHDALTGEVLWSTSIPSAPANVANAVVLSADRVMVSIGYGKGSFLFRIEREENGTWVARKQWQKLTMKAKFTNLVVHEPYAFGLDQGRLACIDVRSGGRVWKGARIGHGQVLGVGEYLLVQAESGEVRIFEASHEEERLVGEFEALDDKTWNQPVLAGRYLLVRNDREAVCFRYPGG